ncbi:MAG TPA: GNAT family N-acetyltransferase [Cytophagaceae bacterium]|jgi:ribosomal protein S18 acetylase RimI-like enzyme
MEISPVQNAGQYYLSRIEIINYSEDLKDYVRLLNYEWLEKYFRVEQGDVIALSNPKEEIIDKGGFIFYAKMNNEIIATASLLKKTDQIFELGKMAVTNAAQGLGIGTMLLEYCINTSRSKGVKKLILYSNTTLGSAIHLYKKYGFYEVELEKGLYERADIKMEMIL